MLVNVFTPPPLQEILCPRLDRDPPPQKKLYPISPTMCVCMYVCVYVCMYVCMYVYVCVCMYAYACVYMRVYVFVYVVELVVVGGGGLLSISTQHI